MRLGYFRIAFLLFAATFSSSGCNDMAATGQSTISEPTPAPKVTEDEKGNSISSDGWNIPAFTAKSKYKSTRQLKYTNGDQVTAKIVSFDPEERVIAQLSPYGRGSEWIITHVDEYSIGKGKVFCYRYSATPYVNNGQGNAIAVTAYYRICDIDGDGKYELKGDGLGAVIVPDWAR